MASEVEGSEKIVYTLWKYGVATGTPIYSNSHWIAVRGVSTSVEPKPGSIYSINGFWINNPWPFVPAYDPLTATYNPTLLPPPPHSATDGCGSGATNRGQDNEYVAYDGGGPGAVTWKNTYFLGCNWCGSYRYISVCDPEPPELGKLDIRSRERWAKGNQLIGLEEATRFALRGIDEHNLTEDKLFVEALKQARPEKPILVQRLDLLDAFYYIVPMVRGGAITATLSVDGLYGNFQGGRAFREPAKRLFVSGKEVLENLIGQSIELGEKRGKLVIRKEAHCFYPIMVWRPCKESRSPYYPFYMITVGDYRVYIGYDGSIYTELHDFGPG